MILIVFILCFQFLNHKLIIGNDDQFCPHFKVKKTEIPKLQTFNSWSHTWLVRLRNQILYLKVLYPLHCFIFIEGYTLSLILQYISFPLSSFHPKYIFPANIPQENVEDFLNVKAKIIVYVARLKELYNYTTNQSEMHLTFTSICCLYFNDWNIKEETRF